MGHGQRRERQRWPVDVLTRRRGVCSSMYVVGNDQHELRPALLGTAGAIYPVPACRHD